MNNSTIKQADATPSKVLTVRDLVISPLSNIHSKAINNIVKGVSFDIFQGEIFALVGESGSGKSLTSLAIMRLLPEALTIKSGEINFYHHENESHVTQSDHLALSTEETRLFDLTESNMNTIRGRKIAMIFQEPQSALNPVQTIGEQLKEVLDLHQYLAKDQLQQKLISLLDEVGIPDPESRLSWYPHQMSGGQKQRVMIAMALACEPELLIADEPTTALDVTIQRQIFDLLNQLRKTRNLSVLLITHDMGVVAEMADRVAVMQHGEILEQAKCTDFFENPTHEYSKRLINSLPKTDKFFAREAHDALLKLTDVKVWFAKKKGLFQRTVGHTKAVNGISLAVGHGETLAIVGESGSGKTTLGKAILRLTDLHSGSINYQGQELTQLSNKAFNEYRKDIQVIFQDPYSSMNPRMSIGEIIEEGMISLQVELDKEKRKQTMCKLLTRVGLLPEHLERFPHEFSGGQRQRIAIARALAVEPKLIICDEPTSALDVSIRGQVLDLLYELQQETGISLLFITHDLSIIPRLAHNVAVMKNGEIVEQGTAQQVMTAPQHEYTKTLLDAIPAMHKREQH